MLSRLTAGQRVAVVGAGTIGLLCAHLARGAVNSTARLATRLARRGARVVLCGIPPASDTFATLDVVSKAFMIRSVFGAPRSARRSAVDAFVDGRLQPGLLVTHEFDLSDVATALGLIADRQPGVGKILLRP